LFYVTLNRVRLRTGVSDGIAVRKKIGLALGGIKIK